ncbi:MAG TPA: septum formation initiator family protein [Roseiarcus sp.]|nr:septum formation initiator family protein [Roseiarcus sp.]
MLVRSRVRAVLIPMLFYLVLGGASAYLVRNASEGQHGAEARVKFDRQLTSLKAQLAALDGERESWRRRVDSLRNESIDRDLLVQEAHGVLDLVAPDEVVIFPDAKR